MREIAIAEQVAALCSDAMGPVGNRLHTANVARDMDEIRKALGVYQVIGHPPFRRPD